MRRVGQLVIVLAIMWLGSGCNNQKDLSPSDMAYRGDPNSAPVYFMTGRIAAGEEVAISSRITARVDSVNGEVGSRVEKGRPLICLDSEDLSAQVTQARAGVDQAEASVATARINQKNTERTYTRYQELSKAGAISPDQLEQAESDQAMADSALNTAQAKLNQAQASLESAEQQLKSSTLVSPISGVISVKNINGGEVAVSGVQLLKVVEADSLIINARLPARLAAGFKPRRELVIKVAEVPGKLFKGRVRGVDPVVDSKSGDLLVKVQFTERDASLKPGMLAELGLNNGGQDHE